MTTILLPAKLENLEPILSVVSRFLAENGMSPDRIREIELAAEEALVNIFNYAYPGPEPGSVEVECHPNEEGRLIVEFRDSGVPFDITAQPEPDLAVSLQDRKVGGLGVFLIRKMVDEVRYRREEGRNVLTFVLAGSRGK